jgi:hypothetical protein
LRWALKQKNLRSLTKDGMLAIHERIPLFPGIHREVVDAANKTHHYQ